MLCLLLVLVLSESFDSFSVGKLISISKEVKKKEKEVEKLESQNKHLLSQIITISNNQTQSLNHTNVYGDYNAIPKVTKATTEEVERKQSDEPITQQQPEFIARRINSKLIEKIGLQKYLQTLSIDPSRAITDVKFSAQFHGIDPISSAQPIFDAYIQDTNKETFIEFRSDRIIGSMFRDRLYMMLSKINHYREVKRVDAHLDLVILGIQDEDRPSGQSIDRALQDFEPAISGGLLKTIKINISKEDITRASSDSV